ncbi:MAG: glycerol-3-phosphate dehydrogenase/oxidase [Actinobacteria bacterium]|nr:glycerol-3-phosphate dehydrogenase/oxidase [Actinomycetota bacterium]
MISTLERRSEMLRSAAADGLDLVVIGGGINGVGILLDAAARGFRCLLLEGDDLAVGTSSRSSKLIHGGLRYLEGHEFGLVRQALAERATLLRVAPHLVDLRRFVLPVAGGWSQRLYIGAGLGLYDGLGGRRGGRFRALSPTALADRAPAVRSDLFEGGFEYSDGVTDDARLVIAVARTARQLGARLVTQAQVTGLLRAKGRVAGVVVKDRMTGDDVEIPSACVVDATGAFDVQLTDSASAASVIRSRGTHLVIARDRIASDVGLTLRVDGRVIFIVPWESSWLLGTTDVVHDGAVARPTATPGEVSYLLHAANRSLDVELTAGDVLATFAGIRPLVGSPTQAPGPVSREHHIDERTDGMLVLRGGKLTTYRVVAAEVVDRVATQLRRAVASSTSSLPLTGAAPRPALDRLSQQLQRRGLAPDVASSLVSRYGRESVDVADVAARWGLQGRLLDHLPYIEAEVWWSVDHEDALTIDDVLSRRTRAALQDRDQAEAAAGVVADILGAKLGWDRRTRLEAVTAYSESRGEYAVPHAEGRIREAVAG